MDEEKPEDAEGERSPRDSDVPEIEAPPTTEPPTTEEPTTEQPTTEQPTTEQPTKAQLCRIGVKDNWRLMFILVWPLFVALIFIAGTSPDWCCAYVLLLMAGYWVTEALPLGITGLLPVFLFPLMDILNTEETCALYLNNTNLMLFVSICIAFAIENSNLHRRIALRLILIVGTTHLRLTLGFMIVTTFVSMWIINTAATAMMAPVVLAVLMELEENNLVNVYMQRKEGEDLDELPYPTRTTRCYFFVIGYAATIGGIGTLIGTGTNYVFKGIYEGRFPEAPPIDFGDWMASQIPIMLVSAALVWVGLAWQYLGLGRRKGMDEIVRKQKLEDPEAAKEGALLARKVVRERLEAMGSCTWAEIWVAVLFCLVIALWITSDPKWMRGWAPRLTPAKVKDSTPGVLIIIIFFVVPITPGIIYCLDKDPGKRPKKAIEAILTWNLVKAKYMWGLLLLVGGGFALSKGMEVSGLSKKIGAALKGLHVLPPWIILFLVCFVASNFTEFTANVAACNILVPVIGELAVNVGIHPIYLMLPATICVSYSFMLPVGTPPNALIAAYANIRTKDMIITGILPSIITLLVVVALFPTLGKLVYHHSTFPDWARDNKTT